MADSAAGVAPVDALIHTKAVPPGNAEWRRILQVNVGGTAHLLQAIEPCLQCGGAVIVISATARHQSVSSTAVDAVMTSLGSGQLADGFEPLPVGLRGSPDERDWRMAAYGLSKREHIRLCERYAVRWGEGVAHRFHLPRHDLDAGGA